MTVAETLLAEYRAVTASEAAHRLEQAAAADRRAEIIRLLNAAGMSYAQIARAVGLTPQRIGALAKRGL
jgi:DNA-directed RNA polymerase specialized sigma24 family protein